MIEEHIIWRTHTICTYVAVLMAEILWFDSVRKVHQQDIIMLYAVIMRKNKGILPNWSSANKALLMQPYLQHQKFIFFYLTVLEDYIIMYVWKQASKKINCGKRL